MEDNNDLDHVRRVAKSDPAVIVQMMLDLADAGSDMDRALGVFRKKKHKATSRDLIPVLEAVQTYRLKTHVIVYYLGDSVIDLFKFIRQEYDDDRKRWSDREVEVAVGMRADGCSIESIALRLERSTQSVATKISQVVGIQQLEVTIKGFIDGDLDGHHEEGQFTGTLRKA